MDEEWRHLRIDRREDVIEVALHSDGGPLHWNGRAGVELNSLFAQLGADKVAKVLILTGAGTAFCPTGKAFDFSRIPWVDVWEGQRDMLGRLLELNLVVIAAVNGPTLYHPEIPLLADIVLACPEAEFAELGHFPREMVPGDGAQLLMCRLMGPSRTRSFYLEQQRLPAAEGHRLGFVHELHDRDQLLPRARALAAEIARRPRELLTYTKAALRMRERRTFRDDIGFSMALEGLAVAAAAGASRA